MRTRQRTFAQGQDPEDSQVRDQGVCHRLADCHASPAIRPVRNSAIGRHSSGPTASQTPAGSLYRMAGIRCLRQASGRDGNRNRPRGKRTGPEAVLAAKFRTLLSLLNARQRRLSVASEALALGCGGIRGCPADQGRTRTRRAGGVSSVGTSRLARRASPVSANSQRVVIAPAAAGHSARTTGRLNRLSNQSAHRRASSSAVPEARKKPCLCDS